jgi:hypothetical protein
LSETFVNKIKNSPIVNYEPLAEPAHLQLAGKNYEDKPISLVQIEWVTMPIVVRLHYGPLRVPDWRFAVVRGRVEEGILGREFLTQILGLDFKLLFEKARQTASAKGIEPLVEQSSVRKVSLPYLGVRYFDQEESSGDLDRLLGAGFGIGTEEEMATALQDLVQRARDNGMSSKGAETSNQLVRKLGMFGSSSLGPSHRPLFRLLHEFRLDRLLHPSLTFFIGINKGGKQLEGLVNAETRCNWNREPILAALGGVQRLAWAGVSCVQVT